MPKYRHEIKMSINDFDKAVLSSRLSHALKRDKHAGEQGYYLIRSLYFDDYDDTAVTEKLTGVKYREKFRIRTYNNSTEVIRLEKKVKNDGMGYKESASLTEDDCLRIILGEYDFLKNRQEMVCKHLYTKMKTGLFKPKTIVDYTREAYVWEPGRIRITLDSDLRTGIASTDFFNPNLPMARASDASILEIKYDSFLPSHISNLLQLDSRRRAAISKYVLCRSFG
ncbi:MAG: transporter [Gracilibacter sp. BRH_c7a]|nr:MAG: transporter [Gracilibacter sp. BRH_c7a]